MKKIYKIIGLLLLVTLIVVGCSSEDTGTKQAEEQETGQSEEERDQKVDIVKEDEEKEDKQEEKEDKKDDPAGEVKSKVLIDMMNSKENTTEIKMITNMGGQETESLITTAISGDKVYSSTQSGATSMRFIEKEDKSYLIMDESKTIIASNRYEDEDGEIDLTSQNLIYDDLEYVGKGREEFLGNQRPYEEYNIELGSVKYYFDGKKLDGMQILIDMSNILDDDLDEEELEGIEGMIPKEANIKMKILSYEKKADSSLFELPEGYQVVGQ